MTLTGKHIEQPKETFIVEFFQKGHYANRLWNVPRIRTVNVLAETEEGALQIAKYHFSTIGEDFII